MAILHRATTSNTKLTGAGVTISTTLSTSVIAGDLLVVNVTQNNAINTISGPAGWTRAAGIGSNAATGSVTQSNVFWRIAVSGDAGATYTWTSQADQSMGIIASAYYDDTGRTWNATPVNAFATRTNAAGVEAGTSYLTADITTTVADTLVIAAVAVGESDAAVLTFTPPSGMTERADIGHGSGSSTLADSVQATAGSTGEKTFTGSVSGKNAAAVIVAFELVAVTAITATGNATLSATGTAVSQPFIANTFYRDSVLGTSGVQSYWRMNESSNAMLDELGTVNGFVSNMIRPVSGLLIGDNDSAYEFSGTNSMVDLGQTYAFLGQEPFSVEAIIRPTTVLYGRVIAEKYYFLTITDRGGWRLVIENSAKKLRFVRTASSGYTQVDSVSVIKVNTTYHIVATYDGTTMRIYINGVLEGQTVSTVSIPTFTDPMRIGRRSDANSEWYRGTIDEVAIYGRAISSTDIQNHSDLSMGLTTGVAVSSSGNAALSATGLMQVNPVVFGEVTIEGIGTLTMVGDRAITLDGVVAISALGAGLTDVPRDLVLDGAAVFDVVGQAAAFTVTDIIIASGTASADGEVVVGPLVDDALREGNNQRALSITDSAKNESVTEFTVTAQFYTVVSPSADVSLQSNGTMGLSAFGSLIGNVPLNATSMVGAIGLSLSGQAQLATTAIIAVAFDPLSGNAPLDATGMASTGVPILKDLTPGNATLNVTGTLTSIQAAAASENVEIVVAGELGLLFDPLMSGPIGIDVVGSGNSQPSIQPGDAPLTTSGLSSVALAMLDGAGVATEGLGTVRTTLSVSGVVSIQALGTMQRTGAINGVAIINASGLAIIELTGVEQRSYRVWADIYNPAGVRLGVGPLYQILSAEYGESLDGVGTFALEIPAVDRMAEYVVSGNELRLYRDGEGLVFRGLIDSRETLIDATGKLTLSITGDSVARQLVWANTLLGREFSNTPMSSAVTALLSGTGWNANSVQTDTRNVTAQYDGASIWQALAHSAEIFGWHVRERNLTRQIDIGKLGAASGLVIQNVEHVTEDMGVLPITRLQLGESQDELWNRVVPVGGGDGINALTLRYATRATPYTKRNAIGPDGQRYYYIEDSASVAEHGLRVKVLSVKDVVPISNSVAEIQNGANTLYDIAAAWLGWHSALQESYQADIVGLKHIVDGQPRFRVGDTVRLIYRGAVDDESGRRLWRSVDRNVYIMGYTRRFNADGSDGWSFNVSTVDRETPSDADAVAKALEDLWAIKTAKRPYTFREIHGPFVESIAANDDARFLVDFDSNITYLHSAMLRVRKRRVKSNVSGAASGGGQTSSSGGGQTTTSGGGQTSSSDGAHSHSISSTTTPSGGGHTSGSGDNHSHSVSGQTAANSGAHWHQLGATSSVSGWTTQPYQQQLLFQTGPQTGFNFGVFVGRGGTSPGASILTTNITTTHSHPVAGTTSATEGTHKHSILNHSHSVSGQTASSSGSHSHSVSNHTHSVSSHNHTVSDHTHALIYGIFLGPTASAPQMRVIINGTDRTTALGGPWNSDMLLDITAYLTDSLGHVLRQSNNVDISSSQLCDVELTCKSLVSALSVTPV